MKKAISVWELIPHKNKYVITEKDVLDYITNLQQENNNLKTSLDESQEVVIDLQQRIEKAVEYIDKHKIELSHSFDEPDCNYWIATNPQDIIDILNVRSDE